MHWEGDEYVLDMMMPPGKHQFFYSFNYHATANMLQDKIARDAPLQILDMYFKDENRIETIIISTVNTVSIAQSQVVDALYEPLLKTCVPWPDIGKFVWPKVLKKKAEWKFETSFFAQYWVENQEFLKKSLDYDLEWIKFDS